MKDRKNKQVINVVLTIDATEAFKTLSELENRLETILKLSIKADTEDIK